MNLSQCFMPLDIIGWESEKIIIYFQLRLILKKVYYFKNGDLILDVMLIIIQTSIVKKVNIHKSYCIKT